MPERAAWLQVGVEKFDHALNDVALQSLGRLSTLTGGVEGRFYDPAGNNGHVLWNRSMGPIQSSAIASAVGALQYHFPEYDFASLGALQLNEQAPYGEQAFHRDGGFTDALVAHVGEHGLFEIRKPRCLKVVAVPTNNGDVVHLSKGRTYEHRGRNIGAASRLTIACFWYAGQMQRHARTA